MGIPPPAGGMRGRDRVCFPPPRRPRKDEEKAGGGRKREDVSFVARGRRARTIGGQREQGRGRAQGIDAGDPLMGT